MYKFVIYAPRDEEVIGKVIDAAAHAGAGTIGNYSHCAFITEGTGHWMSLEGAKPHIGNVGELSSEPEVKIEMECNKEDMEAVVAAVKEAHPYDTVVIDAVEFKRFS